MIKRREFLRWLVALFSIILSGCLYRDGKVKVEKKAVGDGLPLKTIKSKVYVIKTNDRGWGVKELLKHFNLDGLADKRVILKANYNSADPFPASTHIDTLSAIVDTLKERNAGVVLAERSGMGVTKKHQ